MVAVQCERPAGKAEGGRLWLQEGNWDTGGLLEPVAGGVDGLGTGPPGATGKLPPGRLWAGPLGAPWLPWALFPRLPGAGAVIPPPPGVMH